MSAESAQLGERGAMVDKYQDYNRTQMLSAVVEMEMVNYHSINDALSYNVLCTIHDGIFCTEVWPASKRSGFYSGSEKGWNCSREDNWGTQERISGSIQQDSLS